MAPSIPPFSPRRAILGALCTAWLVATQAHGALDERRIEETAQRALAVTIYNDDLALVKDERRVRLEAGRNALAWRAVSAQIRPETARLAPRGGGPEVRVLEQNFDFDLLTGESLLQKYVGRTVEVVRTNDAGERSVELARVLAANDGVVLRYADRIETGVVGHLAFPDVPADLRDEPTLVLHLEAAQGGDARFELSYLTGGLAWQADYVAELAEDRATLDLNGWVTLTNRSGIAYRGARVQLVAGEVNQVRPPEAEAHRERRLAMAASAATPEEEALYEYHLYTLPRATDILDRQTKQVALLAASQVPVTEALVVEGRPSMYRTAGRDGWVPAGVAARLRFANREGPLGIPLPKGVVRVYARDSRGHAQFVGEDAIDHTPRNETVSLELGESFDVTARRKQTSFRKLAGSGAYDYAYEAGFAVELKNAKPAPVTVKVLEHLPGDWRIIEESASHTKEAAALAAWTLEVPAEGSTTLTWVAQVRH